LKRRPELVDSGFVEVGLVTQRKVPWSARATEGFAYLAELFRRPGAKFHGLDLVGSIAGGDGEKRNLIGCS
jgi:hypothetical protein